MTFRPKVGMTSDEINQIPIQIGDLQSEWMLLEIAWQLAKLNETFSRGARGETPVEELLKKAS